MVLKGINGSEIQVSKSSPTGFLKKKSLVGRFGGPKEVGSLWSCWDYIRINSAASLGL